MLLTGISVIIRINSLLAYTYLLSYPLRFSKEVVFTTGFDDVDLYNFAKKNDEKITSLFN